MANKIKIGIVGSGIIGRSWAMLHASAGYEVSVYDVEEKQIQSCMSEIEHQLNDLANRGSLKGNLTCEQQLALISPCRSLQELLQGATLIHECVPEILEIKKKVFEEIDALCDDAVILASSTSGFPVSTFGSQIQHRRQLLVVHPMNPPYYIPAVEVVPAPFTDPAIVAQTCKILESIGKVPIHLKKELPGFIFPRIQAAIIDEGIKLIKEGYVSAEDFDKIMTEGLAIRYAFSGPFEICHLNANGFIEFCQRYGKGMYNSIKDSGPPLPLEGEHIKPVNEYLYSKIPLEKLDARRKWRDASLAALASLKKTRNLEQ